MSDSDDQEKTEDATQQRIEDFRKRGQVAQSKEVVGVMILGASLMAIWALSRFFFQTVHEVFTKSFTDFIVDSGRQEDWFGAFKFAFIHAAMVIAPVGCILWLVGVASTVVQIGFLNNEEALKWDFTRIDPVAGFKKIATFRSIIEGAKSILKIVIVTTIVYFVFRTEIGKIPHLMSFNVEQLLTYLSHLLLRLFTSITIFMGVLAGVDFGWQKWEMSKQMRMTKQEVKEEIKSREGDPMIRARIRKLQREMSSRRMMEDVKKADVIITNPTHIAIAIKYSANMIAPAVVAKGADFMAEKIKAAAKEANIPIIENKPLARTIFRTIKIGHAIPRELYTAVAEVLSFIYKLKKKRV